jgi:serine/threonine protein kinase
MSPWPDEKDYSHYVQNPRTRFVHAALTGATVFADPDGLPQQSGSGQFAVVFRMRDNSGGEFGLKCFLHHIEGRDGRYSVIHDALAQMGQTHDLVAFQYLPAAIRATGGQIVPAVVMEWVRGIRLDSFIDEHVADQRAMVSLSVQFRRAIVNLRRQGAAHGDLQHGNILIGSNGRIKLVDLDGMFVPQLSGERRFEAGHPSYQHPRANGQRFDATIDDFPAWLIYLSLRALARDPLLWQLRTGSEQLLLSAEELASPSESEIVRRLANSTDDELRHVGRTLKGFLSAPATKVPSFRDESYTSQPVRPKWSPRPAPGWAQDPIPQQPHLPVSLPDVLPTRSPRRKKPAAQPMAQKSSAASKATVSSAPTWAQPASSPRVRSTRAGLPDVPPTSSRKRKDTHAPPIRRRPVSATHLTNDQAASSMQQSSRASALALLAVLILVLICVLLATHVI